MPLLTAQNLHKNRSSALDRRATVSASETLPAPAVRCQPIGFVFAIRSFSAGRPKQKSRKNRKSVPPPLPHRIASSAQNPRPFDPAMPPELPALGCINLHNRSVIHGVE